MQAGGDSNPNRSSSSEKRSIIRELLSNPYLGAFGIAVTVLSAILGVVFYFHPLRQNKEATYSYPYTSTRVFDSSSATTYKIIYRDNTQITNDIYTTEFDLWNSSEEPIEPSDVRSPVRIVLFPAQRLLEYKIVTQVRPDVAQFKVREIDVNGNPETQARYDTFTAFAKDKSPITNIDRRSYTKVLEITWDHFDPGFGVKILVTYVGQGAHDKDFRIQPDAYIIGLPALQFGQQLVLARWLGWSDAAMTFLYVGGLLGLMVLTIGMFVWVVSHVPSGKSILFGLPTMALGIVLIFCFIQLTNAKTAPPPFEIPSPNPPVVSSAEG